MRRGSRKLAIAVAAVVMVGFTWSLTARAQIGVASPPVAWAPGAERQVGQIQVVPIRSNVFMLASDEGNSTVQVGRQGVIVVDTMSAARAPALLEAIRTISSAPIVQVFNTSVDQAAGNDVLRRAGRNAAVSGGGPAILAYETVLARMAGRPAGLLPTDTFSAGSKDFHLNGEAIYAYHQPAAYSDGDIVVLFRASDVVSVGNVFAQEVYPRLDLAKGGSVEGLVVSMNRILQLTVPEVKEEGGTMVVPARGRLSDEADVAEYRDMLTIVRDRLRDMLSRQMTLEQVLAAKPTKDYDPLYGTPEYSGEMFVEAVYRSLSQAAQRGADR